MIAKNVFGYLNSKIAIWVDILHHKNGIITLWMDSILAKYSWFLVVFAMINSFNPNATSLLYESWLFEIPLAFKPTYLNMELDLHYLHLFDFIIGIHWNLHLIIIDFGNHLNSYII